MATLIGLVLAFGLVLVGAFFKHVSPVFLFTNVPALFIVFGGAFGATMASFDMGASKKVIAAIKLAIFSPPPVDARRNLELLVGFARKSRHEGLLSLEPEIAQIEDRFMRKGLQLAIDGSDPEAVADVMRTDIRTMKARHKIGADWCSTYGIYAPTFGIIGAVMGLIATLGNLSDPDKLGGGIAAAFVATFWGVFLANGVFLPLANKLKQMSADEVAAREMVMEGVLAIQSGQNPVVIQETLISYLSPDDVDIVRSESVGG